MKKLERSLKKNSMKNRNLNMLDNKILKSLSIIKYKEENSVSNFRLEKNKQNIMEIIQNKKQKEHKIYYRMFNYLKGVASVLIILFLFVIIHSSNFLEKKRDVIGTIANKNLEKIKDKNINNYLISGIENVLKEFSNEITISFYTEDIYSMFEDKLISKSDEDIVLFDSSEQDFYNWFYDDNKEYDDESYFDLIIADYESSFYFSSINRN
jgi:hypothetical protein